MTTHDDFYRDVRYCGCCAGYVPYLRSPEAAWCVRCGTQVTLYSPKDMTDFQAEVQRARRYSSPWEHDEVA